MRNNKSMIPENNELDLVCAQFGLDVLKALDSSFNIEEVTPIFAERLLTLTGADQLEFHGYGSKYEAETRRVVNRDGQKPKKVTTSLRQPVFTIGAEVGELFVNYFGSNVPDERVSKLLPIVADTLSLIINRYIERIELKQTQVKTIVSALASDYGNITYVDLVNGTDMIIKANNSGVLVNDDKENVSYDERVKHYVEQFVVPEEREEMAYALTIASGVEHTKDGKPYAVSCRIMINGEVHYRSVKFVPQMEDGKVVSLVIGYQSVDAEHKHQEELEEALKKAEDANKAKTSFLFSMSHDIRTPMNAITGFTTMAKNHLDDTARIKDYLNKINTSGNQLLALINQVLEMSRIESGKVVLNNRAFNIADKIYANGVIFHDLCEEKGLSLNVSVFDIKHRYIVTDPDRIDQVMNNLLGNAYKYTMEGGSIQLKAVQEEGTEPNTVKNIITVSDTGVGMSRDYIEHIFDAFSRETTSTVSHIQGTGLGMSIVKSVCDMLNAKVTVESEKEVGTTVTIELVTPYDEVAAIESEKAHEASSDFSIKGLRILVVEDNALNREIAEEILTEAGAIVDTAEDGDIAIDKVVYSDPGDIDVILMDVQMPRMNGYEATKIIRKFVNKKLSRIPILAMTANAFEEDRRDALEAGMNDHIAKPIDINKLLMTLSKYMKNTKADD